MLAYVRIVLYYQLESHLRRSVLKGSLLMPRLSVDTTGYGETKTVRNDVFFVNFFHFSAVDYIGGLGSSGIIKALKDHSDTTVSQ